MYGKSQWEIILESEGLIFYVFVRKTVSENLNENIKGA